MANRSKHYKIDPNNKSLQIKLYVLNRHNFQVLIIWSTKNETSSAKDTINNKSNNKIPPNLRNFKSKNSKAARKMKAILTLKVIWICSIRLSNRGTKRT